VPEAEPAHGEPSEIAPGAATDPTPVILSHPKLWRPLRLHHEGLFCHTPPPSGPKRKSKLLQQGAGLLIVLGSGVEADIHPPDHIDLVVLNLGEDDLLFDSQRIIAASVKRMRRHAPKVPDPRQSNIQKPVQELVHPIPPESHLAADGHPCPELEWPGSPRAAAR